MLQQFMAILNVTNKVVINFNLKPSYEIIFTPFVFIWVY